MSNDKKIWKKPEIREFASADEAIAYYSESGMLDHVEAVKKLKAEAAEREQDPAQKSVGWR